MFGFRYIKFDSTTYVIRYKKGKIKSEGRGLAFWYYAPSASIVAIPMGSSDAQFFFEGSTKDFQTVSIQGQITYKIEHPKQLAELLDYTVDRRGRYTSDDNEKLQQRIINEAQAGLSTFMQGLELRETLRGAKSISEQIRKELTESEAIRMLGIVPLSVNILGVKASPEMTRALEAETRESLQQEADKAIYKRRNFAVEQERQIKESELNTEIAVEEKKKQIAEKKMETDIAKAENDRKLREMKISADIEIETQRQALIDMEVENSKKQADAEAYRLQQILEQYKDMDWKKLTALRSGSDGNNRNEARQSIAMAFHELAQNTDRIGTLNITPDFWEIY